jgi:hypothetical protein
MLLWDRLPRRWGELLWVEEIGRGLLWILTLLVFSLRERSREFKMLELSLR